MPLDRKNLSQQIVDDKYKNDILCNIIINNFYAIITYTNALVQNWRQNRVVKSKKRPNLAIKSFKKDQILLNESKPNKYQIFLNFFIKLLN